MSKCLQIDGLPIVNAARPLVLKITKADIARANLHQPNQCAVARAAARQYHVKEARVHLARIYLRTNESNWVRYKTPRALRDEIIAFDRGGAFEPGEFIIAAVPPAEQQRYGKRQGGKDKPRPRPRGKPRQAPHVVHNVRGGPA